MRNITTTVYKFAKLSEQGKAKAIQGLSSINIDFDWWQYTYLDAKNVGININNFELDRDIDIGLYDCLETAQKILKDHGLTCDTYNNAEQFIKERDELVSKYSGGGDKVPEENEYDFDCELDELESEYKKTLEEDYLSMLRNEYEYRTSKEAIIETIEANEYEFTAEGELI